MGVKTLVHLAIVLTAFWIGFSQAGTVTKCYECAGAKCDKPEDSLLKDCPSQGDAKEGCVEEFTKVGDQLNSKRMCNPDFKNLPDKCYDAKDGVPEGGAIAPPGGEIKYCTCYKDKCNNNPNPFAKGSPGNPGNPGGPGDPGSSGYVTASLSVVGTALLLNLLSTALY